MIYELTIKFPNSYVLLNKEYLDDVTHYVNFDIRVAKGLG
jgi:hypothetical protein